MTERELRILRSLIDGLRAIQCDIHAIRDQAETNGKEPHPPPQIDIHSEIRIPPPIAEYYAAEQHERPTNTRRDRIRLGLEAVALLAALLAAGFTYYTLRQVQRQADSAQGQLDTMREQNRPWLKVENIIFSAPDNQKVPILSFFRLPSRNPTDGISLQMQIHIKNIGNAVAQNIFIDPKIVLYSERSSSDLIGDGEVKICTASRDDRRPPIGPPFYRSAVFPGEEFKGNYVTMQPVGADKVMHPKDRVGDFLMASLVSCVGYQYPRNFQTIAVFHIIGPKDQFIEVNKTLYFGEVHLQREETYDYAK